MATRHSRAKEKPPSGSGCPLHSPLDDAAREAQVLREGFLWAKKQRQGAAAAQTDPLEGWSRPGEHRGAALGPGLGSQCS